MTLASTLLIRRRAGRDGLVRLDDRDETVLRTTLSQLAAYAVEPDRAALVHMRDDDVIAGWTLEGAMRLAQSLPPAYAELADALRAVYRDGR